MSALPDVRAGQLWRTAAGNGYLFIVVRPARDGDTCDPYVPLAEAWITYGLFGGKLTVWVPAFADPGLLTLLSEAPA